MKVPYRSRLSYYTMDGKFGNIFLFPPDIFIFNLFFRKVFLSGIKRNLLIFNNFPLDNPLKQVHNKENISFKFHKEDL